jgi:hypothetical protein
MQVSDWKTSRQMKKKTFTPDEKEMAVPVANHLTAQII